MSVKIKATHHDDESQFRDTGEDLKSLKHKVARLYDDRPSDGSSYPGI